MEQYHLVKVRKLDIQVTKSERRSNKIIHGLSCFNFQRAAMKYLMIISILLPFLLESMMDIAPTVALP